MATNFVSRVITIALVFIASSVGKPLGVEVVVCEKKHAIVMLVEEDNCLKHCIFQLHLLHTIYIIE